MVKQSWGIVDIAGQYVQLVAEGPSHYLGKCPFCGAQPDSLVLSTDTQYYHCLACGASGDRYDFVAKSEHVSRAEAILMVGHHTISGEPFPHARARAAAPAAAAAARAPAQPAPAPAQPAPAQPAPAQPAVSKPAEPGAAPAAARPPGALQDRAAIFRDLQNIIPSYQGAALLDDKSKAIAVDTAYPSSAELAGVCALLAPVLEQAGNVYGQSNATLPATLTLASEELAILLHKFGPTAKPRLLAVRLTNPSELPVARRIVVSVSAKLT